MFWAIVSECGRAINESSHEVFMQRALELASFGVGCTSPNPLVGCVVVVDGMIVGEGWHAIYGQAHAEVNAICDALKLRGIAPDAAIGEQGKNALQGATLYVTLEPCNHHGFTPPCTQAILHAGIATVVYALPDPNPKAAGGAKHLEAHGVNVVHGVLEQQARFQNRFFVSYVARKRPYVIAKSATSLDGRIATQSGDSQWITSEASRLRGHQLRQSVDAIIVGADTVIADDPSLSTRLPSNMCHSDNIRHPRPVILDSKGRVPTNKQLLSGCTPHTRTLIATTEAMSAEHRHTLELAGLEVISLPENPLGKGVDPSALLGALGQRGIQSVLLEGGAGVQGSFRDAALIDEVWAFIAPMLIGGADAPGAYAAAGCNSLGEATRLFDVKLETLGDDVLVRGLVEGTQFTLGLDTSNPA